MPDDIPGWEGSIGPFPDQYTQPHVYARDINSGAGNCVCGAGLPDDIHVQAAPGVGIPDRMKAGPVRTLGKSAGPEELRFLLGIAYQAGPDPRIRRGADGGRDYFEAEELEKAAFSFMKSGPRVGLFHLDGTDGEATATVVESYIYRNEEPWDLGDGLVVRKGDWVVGAILSPEAWQLYKAGKITGWSPQGVARRRRSAA